ncbi:MAG: hypothetical protein WCF85_02715 [Rhodospirillaceae bacterium]
MIVEWLEYLIGRAFFPDSRADYLHQAVSLRARHRRCHSAWRPHVEQCRRLILDAATLCPKPRRAVVLGSGLWLEVPVAELATRFDEVVLVDLVHSWPERLKARQFPNLRLVEADVTEMTPAECGGDFLVSANLLSQLPLIPVWTMEQHRPPPNPAELEAFSRTLIERHLEGLRALSGVVCLITDFESRILNSESEIDRDDLLAGVELPPPDREWLWTLAPHPELYPCYDVQHRVAGYLNYCCPSRCNAV